MSLKDIACHVWAIDGYQDDGRARQINDRYIEKANQLLKGRVSDDTLARTARLSEIVDAVRANDTATTDDDIEIYGGFRNGQAAPEHMWVIAHSIVTETMPGRSLVFQDEDLTSHHKTNLENEDFGAGAVHVTKKMAANQKACLDRNWRPRRDL